LIAEAGLETASQGFDVVTYTGNGANTNTISGLSMSPDLVWLKRRDSASHHALYDAVRGVYKHIGSSHTSAEYTESTGRGLSAFNSDGFTIDTSNGEHVGNGSVNVNNATYVAWCWKAGGTASSNDSGSITSSVSANTTYGFSIVSYTGTGSNATVGHGLNSNPDFYVVKRTNAADDWECYHSALGATYYGKLNATDAFTTAGGTSRWNDSPPTDSVFSVGTTDNVNGSSSTYIAYCWSEVPGFSKFGSFTGNGSSTGPTITTGFKPRWVMLKRTDSTGNWVMLDTARTPSGSASASLYADDSYGEYSPGQVWASLGSDGFQITATYGEVNASGGDYIYMAFADKPPGEIIDSLIDTPTNYESENGNAGGNYATLNPLSSASSTLSNGNLDFSNSNSSNKGGYGTIGMQSGKYYFEATMPSSGTNCQVGIVTQDGISSSNYVGSNANGWAYDANGTKYNNGSNSSYGATYTNNDVIGVAFDADNGTLTFYKNGVSQGTAFTGLTSGPYLPAVSTYNSGLVVNFGARPFAYTPPTNHKSLCTQNLTDPTIAKGSTAMDVLTWSGSNGNRSFSSLSLSPDLVWIKQRNQAYSVGHQIYDIVRGAGSLKQLDSSDTTAEGGGNTDDYGYLSSFDSAGFSVTSGSIGDDYVNKSGVTYVGWTWDAGTTTDTSNTAGSITPTGVRANPSTGCSIVKYTGTGSAASVGHGLNSAPQFVIVKGTDFADHWHVYHSDVHPKYLRLSTTDGEVTNTNVFPSAPSSTVFNIGTDAGVNTNTKNFIAYCFAPVAGYSAFGSYTGNGSNDGPFLYTGFKPAFLKVHSILKPISFLMVLK
jgi:hypothetical protein